LYPEVAVVVIFVVDGGIAAAWVYVERESTDAAPESKPETRILMMSLLVGLCCATWRVAALACRYQGRSLGRGAG
jgi:hypothetical protein